MTFEQENDWMDEYLYVDDDGYQRVKASRVARCKSRNITKTPFDKSSIKELIGIEKEWSQLTQEEQWNALCVFGKEKKGRLILKQVFHQINLIDSAGVEDIKNS